MAAERLPLSERRLLAGRLEHEVLLGPARGLEFVLYADEDLVAAGGPRFQLNLNTGSRLVHRVSFDAGEDPRFWFVIDTSIARQAGVPLLGPPAPVAFPELSRSLLTSAVLDALDFYRGVPTARYEALLSACRAWAWAVDGRWRSKGDSARWAMRHLADPGPVGRGLRLRDGRPADPPTEDDVDRVLALARTALAASGAGSVPRLPAAAVAPAMRRAPRLTAARDRRTPPPAQISPG